MQYPNGNFATDVREIQIAVGSKNVAAVTLTVDTGSGFVDFGCNTPNTGVPVTGECVRVRLLQCVCAYHVVLPTLLKCTYSLLAAPNLSYM